MDFGRRPARSWSNQSLNLMGPDEDEVVLRKRLMAEEYKRALVAQIEERRQTREQEKTASVDENRRRVQKFLKDASAKRQEASVQHVSQERPRKSKEPQTIMTSKQDFRRVSVPRADHNQAEMLQKKHLRAEEYKRDLVAQIEEQKLRREQEKATQLEEEKKMVWEQQIKQELSRAKTQELLLNTKRREQPQASSEATQKHKYIHHALWDPVKSDTALRKHLKEEEYKRDLQAQIEEQRQRREKEKAEWKADDQAEVQTEERRLRREKEVKEWRFPQDTLGRRHEVTMDAHASMEFSQSSKYAHNLSCLLDPAQLELIQRKRIRGEEHRRELDIQVAEQQQQRAKEKEELQVKELAQERSEDMRLKREEEFRQQKLQMEQKKKELEAKMEEQRQWREKEVRLAKQQEIKPPKFQQEARRKGLHPSWKEEQLDRTQVDVASQQLPLVARRNQDVSRQLHSTEYVSLKVCKSYDMLGYKVLTVHTKDASSQTEPNDGFMQSVETTVRPTLHRVAHRLRLPSPPVPAVQRWLQDQSAQPERPPSEGGAEVDRARPASSSGPSFPSSGFVPRPTSTPPVQNSLQNPDHTKRSSEHSTGLCQGQQENRNDLDPDY